MQTGNRPHLTFPQPQRSSTSHDTEDEVLIRRIAAHDAEAFTTLYQRYAPRLAVLRPYSIKGSSSDARQIDGAQTNPIIRG
jgi:hypothetical protein